MPPTLALLIPILLTLAGCDLLRQDPPNKTTPQGRNDIKNVRAALPLTSQMTRTHIENKKHELAHDLIHLISIQAHL